jgi:HSP20 family molecular chaperone IbpA
MDQFDRKFNPFQMDWQSFQNNFKGKNFTDGPHEAVLANKDFSWLEDYIQGILSQALPQSSEEIAKKSVLQSEVFETHDYMIAKIKIPNQINPRKIKILFAINQIRLEGLPENRKPILQLPAHGRFQGSKAVFKDDILEIRIPKETNENFKQINVQFF